MPRFVSSPTDHPIAATLLNNYFTSRALGFTTHADGYQIPQPDPARFTPPAGIFLLAQNDDRASVGCGGIRRIDDIDGLTTYEVKHLWIEPTSRGRGWSRLLMSELEEHARAWGADLLVLDTNESLVAAQQLYRSSGYEEISAYNLNKNATHWFKKQLR